MSVTEQQFTALVESCELGRTLAAQAIAALEREAWRPLLVVDEDPPEVIVLRDWLVEQGAEHPDLVALLCRRWRRAHSGAWGDAPIPRPVEADKPDAIAWVDLYDRSVHVSGLVVVREGHALRWSVLGPDGWWRAGNGRRRWWCYRETAKRVVDLHTEHARGQP